MQNIPNSLNQSNTVDSLKRGIEIYLSTNNITILNFLLFKLPAELLSTVEIVRLEKSKKRGAFVSRIFWIKNELGEGKLVRDLIPQIIEQNEGKVVKTRILNTKEYLKELKIKLAEELNEFEASVAGESFEKQIEELADVIEVIKALQTINV